MRNNPSVTLDIVIPTFNEMAVLSRLFERLRGVFSPQALRENGLSGVRFIFVDDGSSDSSLKLIRDFGESGAPVKALCLSRNFGHQNAVSAGLYASTADAVAVMDADLQDPPEVILGMLAKWREGFDVVFAQRRNRKENILKIFCYWAFYRLLATLSEIDIGLDSGDFSLMDRKVVRALCELPEKLRFPRGLRAWVGFKQIGFPYSRDKRHAGDSKYSLKALYRLATDGIASSSVRPLKLIQLGTFFFALLLGLLVALCAIAGLYPTMAPLPRWSLLGFTLTASVGFANLFSLYIISGYIGRMYLETKQRPSYIVMEELNFESQASSQWAA